MENKFLQADLMLINLVNKTPEEILEIGKNSSRAGKLDIPVVVIAPKYRDVLAGTDVQISEKDDLTYLGYYEQLPNLLTRLLTKNHTV